MMQVDDNNNRGAGMPRRYQSILFVGVVMLFAFGLHCATERGINPRIVGYNLYVSAGVERTIYIVDLESREVIDSIPGQGYIPYLAASPDGRWLFAELYLDGGRKSKTFRIDLRSHEVAGEYTGTEVHRLIPLDDEQLLLRSACDIDLIDMQTFEPVWRDIINFCSYATPPRGRRIVGFDPLNDEAASVYDVRDHRVVRDLVPVTPEGDTLIIYRGVIHPNGKWCVFIGRDSANRVWFVVYDMDSESIVYRNRRITLGGEIAVTSDGAFAITSDPGAPSLDMGIGDIEIYDLKEFKYSAHFGRSDGLSSSTSRVIAADELGIVVVAPSVSIPIGILTLTPPSIDLISPIYPTGVGGMAVGPRIK